MGIEEKREQDSQYLDGVAFALVQNDWAGAQTLFLLQERDGVTLEEATAAFQSEDLPNSNFVAGFESLQKVGLTQITEEGKFGLSDKGKDIASRLLKSLPADSPDQA